MRLLLYGLNVAPEQAGLQVEPEAGAALAEALRQQAGL